MSPLPIRELSPEQKLRNEELEKLIQRSKEIVDAMTPEQKVKMIEEQKQSWIKAFAPYGSEQTLEWCEAKLIEVEQKIADATCWGAYLSELNEDRQDLINQIERKKQLKSSA